MRKLSRFATGCVVIMFFVSLTHATGTHFDLSFDSNGKLSTDLGGHDVAQDVAIQPDGKIVVVGYTGNNLALTRYNADGSLDTSFDGDGKVVVIIGTDDHPRANAVALQADGKILVAGSDLHVSPLPGGSVSSFLVARFNTNGSLDTTFAVNGLATPTLPNQTGGAQAFALALQTDGRIVVAGTVYRADLFTSSWGLIRLNANGSADNTFSAAPSFTSGQNFEDIVNGIVILPSGKILAGGVHSITFNNFALAQFNANGSLDTTFGGGDGLVETDFSDSSDGINDLVVQTDGKIVAVGYATVGSRPRFALARYDADGSADNTLNLIGRLTTDVNPFSGSVATDLIVQSDGKIVAVGDNDFAGQGDSDFSLVRYNRNGSLDAAFGHAGILRSDISTSSDDQAQAIVLQPDGQLVVAGGMVDDVAGSLSNFAVARYRPNINTRFDFDGDSRADLTVVRGTQGNAWYFLKSQDGFTSTTFGLPADRLIPADFDGDGIADVGVYRPTNGTWYMIRSSNNTFSVTQFGVAEDLPTPADYDGDGKADLSVFRPSVGTWYRLNSGNGAFVATQFGANGDKPTIGDFDGDGRADLAVFRPSTTGWYRLNSTGGAFVQVQFGIASDLPSPGDFDGDGKTDVSVFRPADGNWYRLNSSDGTFFSTHFGITGD
ncbi:MAG: FG-GAP-like repeat-containing protein, partial [Pyrinomonadaceae bacterium]